MYKLQNYSRNITLALLAVLTSSFTLLMKGDEGVPPDFGKTETTLVIRNLEKMKTQNKKIREIFTEYYKGKFVMTDSSAQYADIDEYRYVLTPVAIWNPATGMGDSRMPANWTYTASITDRKTGSVYPVGYEGGAYGPFFKSYAKRLEKARAMNSGQ
jgi:hypothetical protein